ncbi:hypothetical protein UFOVP26_92 [uncultured Caudovirales phage]|uniref:Uncharacterized protein n=1 Tax=uncultured Caudovirales phage TaxID=2100421 RepID=A0A6J5KKD4_9CAUD|nr:hypothetical protein UFOVP26_92 [uncultured Caudovirales phage]CAB4123562.1 hypothetical protein UFOVP44_5 [uncultured Caudovirales phage]CAB5219742.1 hypothetical protein UFOVP220_134 [uncultured Caudovirales phage]
MFKYLNVKYMIDNYFTMYVNAQAMCSSFKSEILSGIHALGTTVVRAAATADTIKAALYLATATISAATTAYSATGEVTGTNYVAGGVVVTNAVVPAVSGTVGYWTPSASITYTNVTLATSFDCVLLYNSTQANRAISAHTFGAQTVSAGNFTLTMPTNASTTALIRIA